MEGGGGERVGIGVIEESWVAIIAILVAISKQGTVPLCDGLNVVQITGFASYIENAFCSL